MWHPGLISLTLTTPPAYTEGVASLSSSRIGRPSISIQTILDRAHARAPEARRRAFEESVVKTSGEVSRDEALAAAAKAHEKRPGEKYLRSAALGATSVPIVKALGRAVEGAAATKGSLKQRLIGAAQGAARVSMPETVRAMAEGAIGGGVVRAVSDGAEVAHSKKVLERFFKQQHEKRTEKQAALLSPSAVSGAVGSSAAKASTIGRFRGFSTANSLKPAGSLTAGVTDSARSIKSSVAVPH